MKKASASARQRVYLSTKAIFSGPDSRIRHKRKVLLRVRNNKTSLQPLLSEFGQDKLVGIVLQLLKDHVFESPLRAMEVFPDLFATSQHQVTEREMPEVEAGSSTQVGLEQRQSNNEMGLVAEVVAPEIVLAVQEISTPGESPLQNDSLAANPLVSAVSSQQPADGDHQSRTHTGLPPNTLRDPELPVVPSLYPSYLPYKTQHLLLTVSQQILEDCCFDFAQKWLPDIFQMYEWDCPAAVELTEWTSILGHTHLQDIPACAVELSGSSLRGLLSNVHQLRHAAVHRLPKTARAVSQLLQHAFELATALKDDHRARQLRHLQVEVDGNTTAMEFSKNFLEKDTRTKLEGIRRQREELDRQEKELIENMVKEDRVNKTLIGESLLLSVKRVLEDKQTESEGEEDESGDGEGNDNDEIEIGSEESEEDGGAWEKEDEQLGFGMKALKLWRGWHSEAKPM